MRSKTPTLQKAERPRGRLHHLLMLVLVPLALLIIFVQGRFASLSDFASLHETNGKELREPARERAERLSRWLERRLSSVASLSSSSR